MSSDTPSERAVKLPLFDGQAKNFAIWWLRFSSYAVVYKFQKALKDGDDMPDNEDEEIEETTNIGKRLNAGRNRNAIAMASLTMAFTTESLIGLIHAAMSDEWPSGLAYTVVEGLFRKYRPQDTITKVELRQELNKVTMKKNQNPSVLFEQIASIKNRFQQGKNKIAEEDLIAVVLAAAPEAYQSLLTSLQITYGNQITIELIEEVMHKLWRQLNGPKKTNDEESNEMSLSTFAGVCFTCKEKGHRASECPKSSSKQESKAKSNETCGHCGKKGHKEASCWIKDEKNRPEWLVKKMANKAKKKTKGTETAASNIDVGSRVEFLLCNITMPSGISMVLDPNVWIADSAATVHSTGHQVGMFDIKKVSTGGITIANGEEQKIKLFGSLKGTMCDQHGDQQGEAVIENVKLVPTQKFNLFSTTKLQTKGWQLGGNNNSMWLEKDNKKIVFDIMLKTEEGVLFAMYFKRDTEIAGATIDTKTKMSVMTAHEKLGHCSEELTRKTAKALSWELTKGSFGVCEACTIGKAKQKNVPKESDHEPSKVANERIYMDISTIKAPEDGPKVTKPNWHIMVDEKTQLKFSHFYETKNGMIEPTCAQLNKWREAGKPVSFVRLDNAGENKKLKTRTESSDWKLGINFEFTARDTPQQNHLAELGFAIIANRGRALLYRANVPYAERYKLFREAFKTATLLDGLMPIEIDGKVATRYWHWSGSEPAFAKHLRIWGEAGTVKTKTSMTPKLLDRGEKCMFVGYALDHTGDCYHNVES